MKDLKDLGKRFFFSTAVIFFVILLIYFSTNKYFKLFFVLAIGIFCGKVLNEFINIIKRKNIFLDKKILIPAGIFLIFSLFLENILFPISIFIIVFIYLFFSRKNKIMGSIEYFSVSMFSLLYIAIPLGLICPIIFSFGKIYIIYLIVVTKITDIGGYFGGRIFGKRKLIEKVSAKKTKEGAFFGFIMAFIFSISFYFFFSFPLLLTIILGSIFGITSQIGDLIESLFKRDADVKDSSNIPAVGGFLDISDSLLLNIPIFYCFMEAWFR